MDKFEELKEIGAQKIHEKTHISKRHIQAVLAENFDNMNKIQFLGFVSILEREYNVSLDDLKSKGLSYYKVNTPCFTAIEDLDKIFKSPKKEKNFTLIYVSIIIFVIVYFILIPLSSTSNNLKNQEIDDTAIENAKNNITLTVEDKNNLDVSINNSRKENIDLEVIESVKSFKIMPNAKLWVGYIDLQTFKRDQKIFSDELDLDPNKDWLLSFGHGHVDIEINGELNKFNNKMNMRFLYRDGELTVIDFKEFKSLNKGSKW